MTRNLEQLTVPPGTELNLGPSEDSDSVVTTGSINLIAAGELKNGALPVQIVGGGRPSDVVFYFHQPEPKSR